MCHRKSLTDKATSSFPPSPAGSPTLHPSPRPTHHRGENQEDRTFNYSEWGQWGPRQAIPLGWFSFRLLPTWGMAFGMIRDMPDEHFLLVWSELMSLIPTGPVFWKQVAGMLHQIQLPVSLQMGVTVNYTIHCCCYFSVAKLCPTLCDPMDCIMPGFPVLHYLSEFAQIHVHWVSDAIQLSHPLSPPILLPSIFPSIRVFSNESALHIRWPKYWSFSISPSNEYSGSISFRIDWFGPLAVQGTLKSLFPAQFKSIKRNYV